MQSFSEKVYLILPPPSEDDPVSDHERIRQALAGQGYEQVSFPLHILQTLYPLCRDCGFDITVTLVIRAFDWVVTAIELGARSLVAVIRLGKAAALETILGISRKAE